MRIPAVLRVIVLVLGLLANVSCGAFDLKDTEGTPRRLAELRGKWVVVNFWATWCAPCVKEIPEIAKFAVSRGKTVAVLGIAMDWDETGKRETDERKIKSFAKKVGHVYPLVLGDDTSEKTFGKIKGLPTTIVYDPSGKVAWRKTGTVTQELLNRVVSGEKVS